MDTDQFQILSLNSHNDEYKFTVDVKVGVHETGPQIMLEYCPLRHNVLTKQFLPRRLIVVQFASNVTPRKLARTGMQQTF